MTSLIFSFLAFSFIFKSRYNSAHPHSTPLLSSITSTIAPARPSEKSCIVSSQQATSVPANHGRNTRLFDIASFTVCDNNIPKIKNSVK